MAGHRCYHPHSHRRHHCCHHHRSHFYNPNPNKFGIFLAALAALYLPLVVTECHFIIWKQRVTFETWGLSDIWSMWCPHKKTKRKKKTKRRKRQKTEREFNIVISGQFRTLAMFSMCDTIIIFITIFQSGGRSTPVLHSNTNLTDFPIMSPSWSLISPSSSLGGVLL